MYTNKLTEKSGFAKVPRVIAFKKIVQNSTYLNPFNKFLPFEGKIEIRWDPLTNLTSRIVHFPARKLQRFNCDDVVRASLDSDCPFCPANVDRMTSKFSREIYGFERLEKDGITVIPNVLTFDKYCLVAIISKEHFVDMRTLAENGYIVKGIRVLLEVLRTIRRSDPKTRFFSINCNYMPMSGSSILHPHIQAIAGEHPTNYHGIMLQASEAFHDKHGRAFWDVLAEKEELLAERFISRVGSTFWYTPFAPKGNIDIGCIFDKQSFFDLEESDLNHLNEGLNRILMYLDKENVSGFNWSLFSGIYGEKYFRTNMRMIARRFLPPTNAADSNYFDKIHMENACLFFPEDVSDSIKRAW
jgi:UDPglucose--hexose-1-phosphate uridylyltransferase